MCEATETGWQVPLMLCVWLGVQAGVCGAAPRPMSVALVVDPGEAQGSSGPAHYRRRVEAALSRAAIPFSRIQETELIGGALNEYPAAVLPYAPNLSRAGRIGLRSYLSDGGKVLCFYRTYGLEDELGISSVRYRRAPEKERFCSVRFRAEALEGLPGGFQQVSWNINEPVPRTGTRVLGDWLDARGEESGCVAATLSEHGFFFSHVLLAEGEEQERKAGQMLGSAIRYLAARRGRRSEIAVVHGTLSEASGTADARLVGSMVSNMEDILKEAGLRYTVLTDQAVAGGALHGRRVAILPLNFRLSGAEDAALRRFVEEGGKLVGSFSLDRRALPLVGVREARFRSGGESSPFQTVHFAADAPAGFPPSFAQPSPNTMVAEPLETARVIAHWRDEDGESTGVPAVILGRSGLYFSCILRSGEVRRTSQFLLAAIAHLAGGDFYAQAALKQLRDLWQFRRYRRAEELRAACAGNAQAREAFERARALEGEAKDCLDHSDGRGAYLKLVEARDAAEAAFIRSLPSGDGVEFRGAWLHKPVLPEEGWDEFFRGMKRNGLNAFLPNVCHGGQAHYESNVLPLSRLAREQGDQMEEMLAAARRHGVQVHLWRVNFNLWWPGEERLRKFIAEDRVCRDPEGKVAGRPGNATLCPSHPENQRREMDAMVEMVRKFHPHGIHFDYIRYPGPNVCFCDGCRERFEARTGQAVGDWPKDVLPGGKWYDEYLQFRRDQITRVVREVSRQCRRVDSKVLISAAVFSDWPSARAKVAQDWPAWVKSGYLDFVCPMNYTQNPVELADQVKRQREWLGGRVPLQCGIGAWRSKAPWHLADLVDVARSAGADGLCFFQYDGRVAKQLLPLLREGPLRERSSGAGDYSRSSTSRPSKGGV